MLGTLELALRLFEQVCEFSRVTNVAMTLKLDANLDGSVSPHVAANAPIERVLEVASVERFDVRLVCLRECGRRGS